MANQVATSAPLLQALVQKARSNAPLKAALVGGLHEGLAPQGTAYPFLVYQVHYAPLDYDWSSVTGRVGVDLVVHSRDPVQARNLDQLVMDTFQEAEFDFAATDLGSSGQRTLFCRRMLDINNVDLDGEGKKIYMVGGQYEIWIDQPNHS